MAELSLDRRRLLAGLAMGGAATLLPARIAFARFGDSFRNGARRRNEVGWHDVHTVRLAAAVCGTGAAAIRASSVSQRPRISLVE